MAGKAELPDDELLERGMELIEACMSRWHEAARDGDDDYG